MNYTQKGLVSLIIALTFTLIVVSVTAWVRALTKIFGVLVLVAFFVGWWFLWKGRKEYGKEHEHSVKMGGLCACLAMSLVLLAILSYAAINIFSLQHALPVSSSLILFIIEPLVFFLLIGSYWAWLHNITDKLGKTLIVCGILCAAVIWLIIGPLCGGYIGPGGVGLTPTFYICLLSGVVCIFAFLVIAYLWTFIKLTRA